MRILVSGATGNTGVPVTKALSKAGFEVVAITRDPSKETSKELALLKGVTVTTMDHAFDKPIDRAFMVFPNTPDQFIMESDFLIKCKKADVKYIVKIATYFPAMADVYSVSAYGRAHLAIELFLSLGSIPFTSIRPNGFFSASGADLIGAKHSKRFNSVLGDLPVWFLSADDIGLAAASLLSLDDPSPHFGKKYNLDGPEPLSGPKMAEVLSEVLNEKITFDGPIPPAILKNVLTTVFNQQQLVEGILETTRKMQVGEDNHSSTVNQTDPALLALAPPSITFKDYVKAFYANNK